MDYVYGFVVACACTALGYAIFNTSCYNKMKLLHAKGSDKPATKMFRRWVILVIIAGIFFMSLPCAVSIFKRAKGTINALKMLTALIGLTGSACVDLKENRIPNIFPACMAISAVILLAMGYFTKQDGATAYIVSGLISAAGCGLLLTIASLLTKHGIGAGDIKLLCALGLLCGVYTVSQTAFIAIVLCAIVAVITLVTKRKSIQEGLPFGPFVIAGFAISVIFFSF